MWHGASRVHFVEHLVNKLTALRVLSLGNMLAERMRRVDRWERRPK